METGKGTARTGIQTVNGPATHARRALTVRTHVVPAAGARTPKINEVENTVTGPRTRPGLRLFAAFRRGSRKDAVRKLIARVAAGQGTREGDFLQHSLPLERLPQSSPLKAVLDIWSASGGKFDRKRLAPLLERALNGRFVLVEAARDRP